MLHKIGIIMVWGGFYSLCFMCGWYTAMFFQELEEEQNDS